MMFNYDELVELCRNYSIQNNIVYHNSEEITDENTILRVKAAKIIECEGSHVKYLDTQKYGRTYGDRKYYIERMMKSFSVRNEINNVEYNKMIRDILNCNGHFEGKVNGSIYESAYDLFLPSKFDWFMAYIKLKYREKGFDIDNIRVEQSDYKPDIKLDFDVKKYEKKESNENKPLIDRIRPVVLPGGEDNNHRRVNNGIRLSSSLRSNASNVNTIIDRIEPVIKINTNDVNKLDIKFSQDEKVPNVLKNINFSNVTKKYDDIPPIFTGKKAFVFEKNDLKDILCYDVIPCIKRLNELDVDSPSRNELIKFLSDSLDFMLKNCKNRNEKIAVYNTVIQYLNDNNQNIKDVLTRRLFDEKNELLNNHEEFRRI